MTEKGEGYIMLFVTLPIIPTARERRRVECKRVRTTRVRTTTKMSSRSTTSPTFNLAIMPPVALMVKTWVLFGCTQGIANRVQTIWFINITKYGE
ncbi:hypothetical protein SLA2020_238080 [Shorea laevis]